MDIDYFMKIQQGKADTPLNDVVGGLPGGYKKNGYRNHDDDQTKRLVKLVARFRKLEMGEVQVGEYLELKEILGFGDKVAANKKGEFDRADSILTRIENRKETN